MPRAPLLGQPIGIDPGQRAKEASSCRGRCAPAVPTTTVGSAAHRAAAARGQAAAHRIGQARVLVGFDRPQVEHDRAVHDPPDDRGLAGRSQPE